MCEDIPTEWRELDVTHLLGLGDDDISVGDEVWVPVSMNRNNAFRAVKITIEERASVGGFEEKNAIQKWKDNDKTTIVGPAESHQTAEGHEH